MCISVTENYQRMCRGRSCIDAEGPVQASLRVMDERVYRIAAFASCARDTGKS